MEKIKWEDTIDFFKNKAKGIVTFKDAKGNVTPFFFDVVNDETVEMVSDITDNYVESNKAYQDQIAIRPQIIVLSGFVGELVEYRDEDHQSTLDIIGDKLFDVAGLSSPIAKGAAQAQKAIAKVSNVIKTVQNAVNSAINVVNNIGEFFGLIEGEPTKQVLAYRAFSLIQKTRQLVDVETPFGTFTNYAVQSVKLVQSKQSTEYCDVVVTLKEFRIRGQLKRINLKQSNSKISAEQVSENQICLGNAVSDTTGTYW